MNAYQEFIAKSRYARYLPMELRREHWNETTDRWINFFRGTLQNKLDIDHPIWNDLRQYIHDLEALPSMRSIMTAGEALARTNVAAYNCAYLPVDSLRSFDEAMYILLCGTGVGFSVEEQYVSQLPKVPSKFFLSAVPIIVEDSKEGWCIALRQLLEAAFFEGALVTWDVSKVRPAGAPLKTFGGRASGPGPLVDLFNYVQEKLMYSQGRQLTNLEAHDIMCKIGEVVVVGGVRRSAMISLGGLSDDEHALAKTGGWRTHKPERQLANNSAVYHEKPSDIDFLREWLSIHDSYSGERGIFNREASQRQAAKYGRRSADVDYGTNP